MLAGSEPSRRAQGLCFTLKPGGGAAGVRAGVLWMFLGNFFLFPGFAFLAHPDQSVVFCGVDFSS